MLLSILLLMPWKSTAQTTSPFVSMVAQDNAIYGLDESGVLVSMQITPSGDIWFISSLTLGTQGKELALSGDRLYAALGTEGIAVAELAHPFEPSVLTLIADSTANHIAVAGNNILIAASKTVTRVDVTDLQAVQFTGYRKGAYTVQKIVTYSNDRLLVASSTGLEVLDVSAADTLPTVATQSTYRLTGLVLDGTTAYGSSKSYINESSVLVSEPGFVVYDLTDVSVPDDVGYIGTLSGQTYYLNDFIYRQFVPNGNRVYANYGFVGDNLPDQWGVRVMNVSTPSAPSVGTDVLFDTAATAMVMTEGMLVVNVNNTLQVYSLTDPANPTLLNTLDVPEEPKAKPSSPVLVQAWPNPFNPSLNVAFTLPRSSRVRLELVNLLGRVVWTQEAGALDAGRHLLLVRPETAASGVYFLRVSGDAFQVVRKVQLVK